MTTVAAGNVRNTIGKYMLADGMDLVIDLEKSHGSWLVDGRDNKEFLDLFFNVCLYVRRVQPSLCFGE